MGNVREIVEYAKIKEPSVEVDFDFVMLPQSRGRDLDAQWSAHFSGLGQVESMLIDMGRHFEPDGSITAKCKLDVEVAIERLLESIEDAE